jgi:hypothetical protein
MTPKGRHGSASDEYVRCHDAAYGTTGTKQYESVTPVSPSDEAAITHSRIPIDGRMPSGIRSRPKTRTRSGKSA